MCLLRRAHFCVDFSPSLFFFEAPALNFFLRVRDFLLGHLSAMIFCSPLASLSLDPLFLLVGTVTRNFFVGFAPTLLLDSQRIIRSQPPRFEFSVTCFL